MSAVVSSASYSSTLGGVMSESMRDTVTTPQDTSLLIWHQVQEVLKLETQALETLQNTLEPESVIRAVRLILSAEEGRLIISGMGKSGHVGRKLAATFASTGTPSFFIHPAEGVHGDLGMVTPKDVVMLLSNSGETTEILSLLPTLRLLQVPIISITNTLQNTLAQHAQVALSLQIAQEACPLNLAPTASTTATLALGDALALCLMQQRAFTKESFAVFHPAGSLGKRLLCRVGDILRQARSIRTEDADVGMPLIRETDSFLTALLEMTAHQLGHALVLDAKEELVGILSDGDVRRALTRQAASSANETRGLTVAQVMTYHPKTITSDTMAIDALQLMHDKKITALPVLDAQAPKKVLGLLHLHDLLDQGFKMPQR
ncbi:MAG: SIS domain-containing protein [Vampirovibrionales bacterium]